MHYVPASFHAPRRAASAAASGSAPPPAALSSAPVFLLTAIVGLLLGADSLIGMIDSPAWMPFRSLFGFRLALLAAVLGGARILYHTLEGLFEGRIGADLALTTACLAAIIMGQPEVAALVVFIALCGESLEGFTARQAQRAIGRLYELCPKLAHVLRNQQEFDLPLDQVVVGDLVIVRPGERVPVDGTVLSGRSAVDQSALTGESWPVDKQTDDAVYAGSLNQFGSLTVAVDRVGDDTTYGQIVQLVADATARKTPLERTADRLARYFLPVVLAAAGLTLVGWRLQAGNWQAGWMPALAVLVVACPCPLILATPSAVLAAMAWLARKGVVIKGSFALERLAEIDTIAFDKTGTLTEGRPVLGTVHALGEIDPTELLRIAAAAERHSEHVLARLIVTEAEERGVVLPETWEFTMHPGAGVTAQVRAGSVDPALPDFAAANPPVERDDLRAVTVGNRLLLESRGIALPDVVDELLADLDRAGQTVLLVAIDRVVIGAIGVRDALRAGARPVLAELRGMGIGLCALLTGDRKPAAQTVAQTLGMLDHMSAEMLPADKARWIEEQMRAGRRVAMVGDGINDAPALAAATVGLALGGVGSQIAAEAGDVILMGDPLAPLPGLLRLSRELVRVIKQSIYLFAFGLNGLGVVLSAWGVLNPVGAAIFHEFASIAVMLNALRLLWFEGWDEHRLGRWVRQTSDQVEWWSQALSPSRAAVGLVRHASVIARLGLAAAVGAWFLSNLVLLTGDEQALVTRFGKFEAQLGPGLHLRWPPPLERVTRERTDRVRTLQIGFRGGELREQVAGAFTPPIEWQAEHNELGYDPQPDESQLLAGDEVPVEITAELHYRVRDLRQFAYGVTQGEAILRATAERALREVAARLALDEILTGRRAEIEAACLGRVQQQAAAYGLGIEVTELNLLDIHPPTAVVPNYRQVADAMEEREQLINEAQVTYARELLSVVGEAAVRVLNGASERGTETPGATGIGNWKLDDEVWSRLTDERDGPPLLSGAAAARLAAAQQSRVKSIQAAEGDAARFQLLLAAFRDERVLTTFQLYWNAVEQALANSSLIILDPQAAGRKHFFLGNGEPFDPQLPAVPPPASNPAPTPTSKED